MAVEFRSLAHKTWRTIASIQTGVVLLILVVILSAVGTIVLQRPVTEPDEMQSAYSPQALRILDAIGLTDRLHRSFPQLLALLLASLQMSRRKLPPRFTSTEIAGNRGRRIGVGSR